jgi:hypothetical protein
LNEAAVSSVEAPTGQAFFSPAGRSAIHPIQRVKELAAKEELENCEKEMMEYIADSGGLSVPLKPGR